MPDNYAWIDKLSPYEAQAALGGIKDQFRGGMTAREATDSFTYERTAMIAALAIANEIPAIYAFPRFVHDGGLMVSTSPTNFAMLAHMSPGFSKGTIRLICLFRRQRVTH